MTTRGKKHRNFPSPIQASCSCQVWPLFRGSNSDFLWQERKGLKIGTENSGRERGDRVQTECSVLLPVSWVACSISVVMVLLFSAPVCGAGVTTALASHWILSEASAVRHGLGRIFLAPNSNPSSRKCLSVKGIHMENTCFQALCTNSNILVGLCFYFCILPGMFCCFSLGSTCALPSLSLTWISSMFL